MRADRAAEADVVVGIRRAVVQIGGEDAAVRRLIPIAAAKNGVNAIMGSTGFRSHHSHL